MSAYQLGPLVLSAPRFYAALGLLVLIVGAELVAWRGRRSGESPNASATWAWSAALAVVLGARVGFVIENLRAFLDQPLAILPLLSFNTSRPAPTMTGGGRLAVLGGLLPA